MSDPTGRGEGVANEGVASEGVAGQRVVGGGASSEGVPSDGAPWLEASGEGTCSDVGASGEARVADSDWALGRSSRTEMSTAEIAVPAAPVSRSAGRSGTTPRMGGIALANGLVLVSERFWAAAIEEPGGGILAASGRKPRVPVGGGGVSASGGVPLVRGLGRFAESLLVLAQVKTRLPQAELPIQGARILAALAASVGATSAVKALAPNSAVVQETGGALAAFIPAVLAVKNSTISGYHGAEHKIIGGMEAVAGDTAGGVPGTSQGPSPAGREASASTSSTDEQPAIGAAASRARRAAAAKAARKEHDRCGTNLIGPFLIATVATNLLTRRRSGDRSPVSAAVTGAVSLGVALEALRWATTHGDSVLARLMLLPGRAVQKRLTTSEPTAAQLEVGQRALTELLRLEEAAG